jgi:hypothetical protein
MDEIWKPVPGYEAYEVSNRGNVRRCEKAMKFQNNGLGYHRVSLWNNNIQKHFMVHRLVALAFIPNPEGKPTVDHINEIKFDNHVENLRWATHSEQHIHSPNPIGVSGHRHISKNKNRWLVQIKRNYKFIIHKSFPTLEQAIEARDTFLESHFNSSQLSNPIPEVI